MKIVRRTPKPVPAEHPIQWFQSESMYGRGLHVSEYTEKGLPNKIIVAPKKTNEMKPDSLNQLYTVAEWREFCTLGLQFCDQIEGDQR